MDFGITQEHLEFRESVARFIDRRLKPLEDRIEREDEIADDVLKTVIAESLELGLYGFNLPTSVGGPGLPMVAQALISEELGRTTMPLASPFHLSETLVFASPSQRSWFVEPVVTGKKRTSIGFTEPDTGSDLGSARTKARREGNAWILNGSKQFISHADTTDFNIVLAVTDPSADLRRRFTSFIVKKDNPGFRVTRRFQKMGWRGYHLAAYSLDDCVLTDDDVLGPVGGGFDTMIASINETRIHVGARCVGMADDLLRRSRDWANERKTFGRKLGDHQAILFKLADMDVELDAARLLTYKAAALFDAGSRDTRIAASRCKLYATEMLGRAADSAVQIFGGAGYMCDLPIERIYRDARAYRIGEGTSEMQRIQIGRNVLSRDR